MRHISTETVIHAPVERVWHVLTELPEYPQWNPLIRSASGELCEGGALELFIAAPGLADRRVRVKVLRLERLRVFRWLGRLLLPGLLDGDHEFRLDIHEGGSVRLQHQETFRGLCVPFVAPWLMPGMTDGFNAMNEALKRRAESCAP